MVDDTVTKLRRKDYKPQLQAQCLCDCWVRRSEKRSLCSWMFLKCKPSC